MRWLYPVFGLLAAVVLLWVLNQAQSGWRAEAPMLPLSFAHADHREVNCISCHHNFIDKTGQGLCFDCHTRDPAINALREVQFHGLCRDCHSHRQSLGEDAGPLRACTTCHTADDEP